MTGNKYCVIHGHFYQPPREDPWEDEIETQPSAAPFHDWNDRIYDECYRPNSFSRILDGDGEIVAVNNNFSYMNFNFGPTLFRWIAKKHPTVYGRVIEADKRSCQDNDGHGSAIAQVYNHIIMPLASKRDKITQIRWAKSFFKRHFNREPEGMWLAETAINMETVECLADQDIKFVVLSPTQADSFRKMGKNDDWNHAEIDTRYPYRCFVENQKGERNGKYVDIFFYTDELSRQMGFGEILGNADYLTEEINKRYDYSSSENQLVNLATDGETFGHHKKNADMCLAYFFRKTSVQSGIKVVNYATYLAQNPPTREVRIKNAFGEGTAWSCAHGTGRWIRDCGCNTGGLQGWNQKWREPFRRALTVLQTEIDFSYLREMNVFFADPAEIRNQYELFIDKRDGLEDFLRESAKSNVEISDEQMKRIIMLLEAQKYMLFAFTSCAWFFNDISGLEPAQNMRYAIRAWQLMYPNVKSNNILRDFLRILEQAKSNFPGINGKTIIEKEVFSMINHIERVAFSMAVNNYLYADNLRNKNSLDDYAYLVKLQVKEADCIYNKKNWRVYSADVLHKVSLEQKQMILALYKDGNQIEGVVFDESKEIPVDDLEFSKLMKSGKQINFTLADMITSFKDSIVESFVETLATDTYKNFLTWMGEQDNRLIAITDINKGLPGELAAIVRFYITKEWEVAIDDFLANESQRHKAVELLTEIDNRAKSYGLMIDKSKSAEKIRLAINTALLKLNEELDDEELVRKIRQKLDLVHNLSIPLHFHQVQDRFYLIYKRVINDIYPQWIGDGKPLNNERKKIALINKLAQKFGFNTYKTAV